MLTSLSASPALLSTLILGGSLALFVSERVRHDMVALMALFACVAAGLVAPARAFSGFADPAVLAVAAILVVGRAIELSGAASAIARVAIPGHASFGLRLTALLGVAMLLSAFMNNIAALVITMPVGLEIAREARRPVGAVLMPLSFASILGGMTTLIGTPANLILSSIRQTELGAPFGFFAMTPVAGVVALAGLAYLALIGWRLLPVRGRTGPRQRPPRRCFEVTVRDDTPVKPVNAALRAATARVVCAFRHDELVLPGGHAFHAGDRLLLLSRQDAAAIGRNCPLVAADRADDEPDSVTAHVVIGHGSPLAGHNYREVHSASNGQLRVVAVGPRAAIARTPLARMTMRPGDQLFIRGPQAGLARYLTGARLLEIDRLDPMPLSPRRAALIVGLFVAAIAAIVFGGVSPALAFVGAAALIAGGRLMPADEIYRSIDWSVIVLLGAMIPVGQSFETSGAAPVAAHWFAQALANEPAFVALGALCAATLLLSIMLNNVATAVIMGPLAIQAAQALHLSPDAALIAVLIGTSSDFLTPIGHQNNLLVMGPGGYRFTDYARMGALLVVLVVVSTAAMLTLLY